MNEPPSRLPPALLLGAQAAVWPGLALLRGESVEGSALLATALALGASGTALALRLRRPVLALALLTAVCAVGGTATGHGGFDVLGTAGVGVALYSVARHRDAPTAWISAVALTFWQVVWDVPLHTAAGGHAADLVLTVAVHALALGVGLSLRRWERARLRFASRLELAERVRRRLPTAERDRLARELHDVSAHQLTAVVVTVEAARKLGDRKPELAAEALDFAARTGREVRDTLGRTPATPATGSGESDSGQAPRVEELAAGFRRLGQPVTVEMPRTLTAGVADAVYGIVREALTNALRHAPGSAVRVRCVDSGERVELTVENDPPDTAGDPSDASGGAPDTPGACDPPADGALRGLGGGRGLAGLRERARAADGELTAGPTAPGGWRVRADFPSSGAAVDTGGSGTRLSRHRVAQLVAATVLCTNPLLPALASSNWAGAPGAEPGTGSQLALLAGVQALPLLGLRRAPHAVLCTVLALASLWPLTGTPGTHPLSVVVPLAVSTVLTAVAVGAVAEHADGGQGTRYPVPLCAGWHTALAALAVTAGGTRGSMLYWVAGTAAVTAGVSAVARRFGHGRRRGHARREDERRSALAASVTAGVAGAQAERQRIVSGLRESVLERVELLVERAEAGQLSLAATEARNALTAMRELLGAAEHAQQSSAERTAERTAEPGTAALDLLCQQHGAMGREVGLTGLDRLPELPRATDLAAFRMAETALGAEAAGPARIALGHADGWLTIDVTGAPGAARGAVRRRLEAQRQAAGAEVADISGGVRVRLPAGPAGHRAGELSTTPGGTPAEEGA